MSDRESDDEGQSIERQPRRRYANHANALASNRRQQRMLPHRPQMHHQVPPQMQPTQRKSSCGVHPDIQTDARQHNVPRHHKIATLEHASTSTLRIAPEMPQVINSTTETRTVDLLPTVLPTAKLDHHAMAVTKHRRALLRTMIVSESSKMPSFEGTDIPQIPNTCIQVSMGARDVLTQDQTLK